MSYSILFIVNSLKRRGAEQQLFSFLKKLPSSLQIHVFTFSKDREDFPELFCSDRVSVHTNPYSGTYNPYRILPLIDCLRRENIDTVITMGLGAALVFGRILSVLFNKKIIYSTLNTFENFNRLPKPKGTYFDILNLGINRLFPLMSKDIVLRFLPNSDQLSDMIKPSLKGYPVKTLYNGLPLNEFAGKLKADVAPRLRSILSEIEGRPCVIQVGALDANKNAIFTLECMHIIRETVSDVCLVVVGDGPVKQDLENWVRDHDMEDCVHFAGQLPRADCITLMKKASLITLTSLSESFPNVLLEGQGLGLPALTFDVGAAAEIVKHGETGYVTPVNDRNEFTQRLVELLKDRDKSMAMGKRGQERIRNTFSMERKVETFMTMLQEDLKRLENEF